MGLKITGKKFEEQFKKNWLTSFPKSFIIRLSDQQSGYAGGGSRNPCDFICYVNGKLFLMECKAHSGNTLPLSAMPQYDLLVKYKDIEGVNAGFVCWFYDKDTVIYVPVGEVTKMIADGCKSVNINNIDKYANVIVIPSTKKRTYMDSDYTVLGGIQDEN